jgi:hypothetical protein
MAKVPSLSEIRSIVDRDYGHEFEVALHYSKRRERWYFPSTDVEVDLDLLPDESVRFTVRHPAFPLPQYAVVRGARVVVVAKWLIEMIEEVVDDSVHAQLVESV